LRRRLWPAAKSDAFRARQERQSKGVAQGRSVGAILQDVVRQKIRVTESGKTRPVPAIEGKLRRLANDALRGDAGAVNLLLSLVDRYGDSPKAAVKLVDVLAEDREILEQYLRHPDNQQPSTSDTSVRSAAKLKSDEGGDNDDTL
jgi:hypothetical protein